MRTRFHPEAQLEFEEAIDFYDLRAESLGRHFETLIVSGVQTIGSAPERWPIAETDVRRYVVNRFPYTILYSNLDEYVLIVAVAHTSREPGYWRVRLDG